MIIWCIFKGHEMIAAFSTKNLAEDYLYDHGYNYISFTNGEETKVWCKHNELVRIEKWEVDPGSKPKSKGLSKSLNLPLRN